MSATLMQRADQVMAATYQRFPVVFEKGRGCQLWDSTGRAYTDFVAGIAVCNLGSVNLAAPVDGDAGLAQRAHHPDVNKAAGRGAAKDNADTATS